MGMISGGHGPGLQVGGSGMMMPSAKAAVGRANVENRMKSRLILIKVVLVFIISS